jgi:hypothetical protein
VKKLSDAGASLEADQFTGSSDDVREYTSTFTSSFVCWYSRTICVENLMRRFIALGNECVEYLKAAKASEGKLLFLYLFVLYAFLCFFA